MSPAVVKDANEAIALAANIIAAADRNLKLAAEYVAFAEELGKTQRQIADGVGKSVGWVNRLLQWRRAGYLEDTPFGASSQERDERRDERIREQERELCSGPEQEPPLRSKRQQKSTGRSRQRRAHNVPGSRAPSSLSERDRDILVKVLGMLGSDSDHEVVNAAREAEEIRKRLGLMWNDLIVLAADEQKEAA